MGQHCTSYFGLDEEQLSTVGYPWCNRPDWKPENLPNFHLLLQLWNPTQASHFLEDSSRLIFSWMATQCSLQVFPYCTPGIHAWFFARGKNPPVKWLLQPLSSHWLLQSWDVFSSPSDWQIEGPHVHKWFQSLGWPLLLHRSEAAPPLISADLHLYLRQDTWARMQLHVRCLSVNYCPQSEISVTGIFLIHCQGHVYHFI